ncbi:MAG: aldehyde dehydrogenase family protein [Devosia sp.]
MDATELRETGLVKNLVGNRELEAANGLALENLNPATGSVINQVAASTTTDVAAAVAAARGAFKAWSEMSPLARGNLLFDLCQAMQDNGDELARIVAEETGKSFKDARGEVGGAIQCGRFFAGEGTRLFGRTMPSGQAGKYNMTVRRPIGVAGLIIAANTPIANVAWKLFPALICGNTVVLKAAETAPGTALAVARLAVKAGLPSGVFNLINGLGTDAGQPLVEHPDIDVISFTGSSRVGHWIAEACARTLKKVSLELGGKNPLVVCADADLDRAAHWVCLSAFSNAGQRCAAGSRILVQQTIYETFVQKLVAKAREVTMGVGDGDLCGPVITEGALGNIVEAVDAAVGRGARVLVGGKRATDAGLASGYYMQPTLIDTVGPDDAITETELFGPVAAIYPFADYAEALKMANDSPYGLTACIHTRDVDRAMHFAHNVSAGVAVVNAGTYGSEPHMPFGGLRNSGNGSREPGTEALDIYSNLKDIYIVTETNKL